MAIGANVIIGSAGINGGRAHASRRLRGTIRANPQLTAHLTVEQDMVGALNGGAHLTAALSLGRNLAGAIGGVDGPAADITWAIGLHGAIVATPALTANLTRTIGLSGSIANTSALTGNLKPYVTDPLVQLANFLYLFYDADDASKITQSGGIVSNFVDSKAAFAVAQATSGNRPSYAATNFNGHASLTFDGVNDQLIENTGVAAAVPTGSAESEIWALVSQDAPNNSAGTRIAVCYGGPSATAGQSREVRRFLSGSINRAVVAGGNGTTISTLTETSHDFSGIHAVRCQFKAGGATISVDNGTPQTVAFTLGGTGTTTFRLGAGPTGGSLWQGKLNKALVTKPLSDLKAQGLWDYLKSIGGYA